jgi:hypothetical protein
VTQAVRYKQPRKLNWVVAVLLLGLVAGAYLAWVYLPVSLRKSEVMRVLDETSSEFTGQSSRMMAEPKLVEQLQRSMSANIQLVGVSDPQAEYWIDVDGENQIRFGALYSELIELPFSEPRETIIELEMLCTRPGRGTGWTCEGRDLRSGDFVVDRP